MRWLLRQEFSLLIRVPFTGVRKCHGFDLLLYEEGKTSERMHVLPESASSLLLLRERQATRSRARFRGHWSRVSLESRACTCIFPLFCRKPPSDVFQMKFIYLFIIYLFFSHLLGNPNVISLRNNSNTTRQAKNSTCLGLSSLFS